MKIIEVVIVAGLAGCTTTREPTESPRVVAPCHADAREAEAMRRELAESAALLDQGRPEDIDAAARQMAALLEHPVFHTRAGRPAVDGFDDPRAFVEWWRRGGDSWARSRLDPSPTDIEIPPTLRSVIDSNAVPDAILCSRPMTDCRDPMASAFLDTVVAWGLELEAYERGRLFSGGSGLTTLNHGQEQCEVGGADEWLDCVSGRRSARAELPLGDYRFPTSGWFFVSRYGLLATTCPAYLGVNLESGEVLSANDCDVREGRGSPERFREFALLALLAGEAEDIAPWQRFEAPAGVEGSPTCSLDSAPPALRVRSSAHGRLAYWWWREGEIVAEGVLRSDAYDEPASALASKLLRVAEYTVVDGSASLLDQVSSTDPQLEGLLATLRR